MLVLFKLYHIGLEIFYSIQIFDTYKIKYAAFKFGVFYEILLFVFNKVQSSIILLP